MDNKKTEYLVFDPETLNDGFDPSPYDRILMNASELRRTEASAEEEKNGLCEKLTEKEPAKTETPGNDEVPEKPEVPDIDEAPEKPEVPDTDEAPEKPEVPDTDEAPEKLEVPDADEAPEKPEPSECVERPRGEKIELPADEPLIPAAADTPAEDESVRFDRFSDDLKESREMRKIVPLGKEVKTKPLKITEMQRLKGNHFTVEEDILVPDIKPDIKSILAVESTVSLSDKGISTPDGENRVTASGKINLSILYLPEGKNTEKFQSMQAVIPFRHEISLPKAEHDAESAITVNIAETEYSVINERKLRARMELVPEIAMCKSVALDLFCGIEGSGLETLEEEVLVTDLVSRKKDTLEIEEILQASSGANPEEILLYDLNVVETHRQLSRGKVIINGHICYNVLFANEMEGDADASNEEEFIQGKVEFTQFVPVNGAEELCCCRTEFDKSQLCVVIEHDEEETVLGGKIVLKGTLLTAVEGYKTFQKSIIKDVYHREKEMIYDLDEHITSGPTATGSAEVSFREVIPVPEEKGDLEKVVYMSATSGPVHNSNQGGRVQEETELEINLICIPSDSEKGVFTLSRRFPVKGTVELGGALQTTPANSRAAVRELRYDKINGRQLEVTGSVVMSADAIRETKIRTLKNPCYIEENGLKKKGASIIIYVVNKGDSLWEIAKKFHTTVEILTSLNHIEVGELKPGSKLVIAK